MFLADRLTLDGTRRTNDGYMAATAKVARTGIQEYFASELGDKFADRAPNSVIRVYRPESEVFDATAMATFAHKPVTINHPSEAVTADNWKRHAVGMTGGEIARDGAFISIPMALMDAAAIKDVEAGKRELSMGYTCDLKPENGTTADGLSYEAIQTNIRANHLAIVDRARGGPELKIGDSNVATKTITFDGISIEVTDQAAQAIEKLQGQVTKLTADASAADAKHATELSASAAKIATLDAEIATLKTQIMTGDALDKAVAERAKLIADAKTIAGDKLDVKGTNDEIKKRAVLAKLGDAYKDRDKAFFDAAFELQVAGLTTRDPVRDALINGGLPINLDDGAKKVADAHAAMVRGLTHPGEKAA